jgi:hypothetical protein
MIIDQKAANAEMEAAFNEAFETDPEFAAAATGMMHDPLQQHPDADQEDEDDAPMGPSEEKAFMMLFRRVRANRARFPSLNKGIDMSLKTRERDDIFGQAFVRAWLLRFVGPDDTELFEDDGTLKHYP